MDDQRSSNALTIAALFVQSGGVYFGLEGVDPWDEERDARLYAGPYPVVAHPPCARWSMLAKLAHARGAPAPGEDAGCFESALASVRRFGGVLEHPAWSWAFKRFGLGVPRRGRWARLLCGGWITEVDQAAYGHDLKKSTWLYAFGVAPPALDWRPTEGTFVFGAGSQRGDGTQCKSTKPALKKSLRSRTPEPFRDLLIQIARSAAPARELRAAGGQRS